jgi:peptidoglycan/xylan/chitin deacetylase (PgdA/CDA1 family)
MPPPLALVYHGVSDVPLRRDASALFVRPSDLRRHVEALRRWGYRLVTFGALAAAARDGRAEGHAALTFDDGIVDTLETAVPLLAELSAPATVFVVSGWLGQRHPDAPWTRILTADEAVELARAGIEVGAHSVTHPDLTTLSREAALRELAQSKADLEEVTGRPVEVAAYPYGRATRETIEACREAGFAAAGRSTGRGTWHDALNLPRQDMQNGSSVMGLRLKRDGRYETLMRHRTWRGARRISRWAPRAVRSV